MKKILVWKNVSRKLNIGRIDNDLWYKKNQKKVRKNS